MRLFVASFVALGALHAQVPNPTQNPSSATNQVVTLDRQPLYKVTVVSRTVKAVDYRHRSGVTKVDLQGTALMPKAHGEAKINSKQGYLEVNAKFRDLGDPQQFGPEYLTYVLWAITPEGRSKNMGEVLRNSNDDSHLDVTTEMQSFGLIVTAEPYYSVTQPSDVVVMENIVRSDTMGAVEDINAKFELLQRGQYTMNVNKSSAKFVNMRDTNVPLELYEARNAVEIARWAGADRYAGETFNKAQAQLSQAENYLVRKQKKPTAMMARTAAQTAEDARIIALKRMDEERLAQERQAAADREAAAKRQADEAARQRALAEEQQRLEAQRRTQAEADAKLAEANAKLAEAQRQQSEQARLAAEKARQEAEAAQRAASQEKAAAEAARAAALAQQQQAQQEAEKARLAAQDADRARMKAESDTQALRQQLLQQFNMILETRDTARGLIVNMSDVLFDSGKYTLRQGTREKLARVSGILLAHPGLKVEVEGHTDSVGSDAYNQTLSENRANAVREYLTQQGLNAASVTAKGFGKTMPVATNDTAAGRQQNRRVELVVSGEIIGTKLGDLKSTPSSPR